MKVTRISVKRFQSLWDVEVELGQLTVIVGPSNSGKSAFGRAVRTVARNTTGSTHVAHGAKTALVSAELSSGDVVTIERGKGASAYRITNKATEREDVYTKSGTNVPEDVAQVLGMPEPDDGPDPHFTTQFDGPYLLNAGGSVVAKAVGSLTNVTVLAEAAREANRRRLDAQRTASVRGADAKTAAGEVRAKYGNLAARKAATESARARFEGVQETVSKVDRVTKLVERARTARAAEEAALEEVEAQAQVAAQATDALDGLTEKLRVIARIEMACRTIEKARGEASTHEVEGNRLGKAIEAAEAKIQTMLKEVGTCPTCAQKIT